MTNYFDSLTAAVQHLQDWDISQEMLPLTIQNEACLLAGLDSDRMGCTAWD